MCTSARFLIPWVNRGKSPNGPEGDCDDGEHGGEGDDGTEVPRELPPLGGVEKAEHVNRLQPIVEPVQALCNERTQHAEVRKNKYSRRVEN